MRMRSKTAFSARSHGTERQAQQGSGLHPYQLGYSRIGPAVQAMDACFAIAIQRYCKLQRRLRVIGAHDVERQ